MEYTRHKPIDIRPLSVRKQELAVNLLDECFGCYYTEMELNLSGMRMKRMKDRAFLIMKKNILLFGGILILSLWLCGCEVPNQAAAPIKQPLIETPNPFAEHIEVSSSLPLTDPVPTPSQTSVPADAPSSPAVSSPLPTEEPAPASSPVPTPTVTPAPTPVSVQTNADQRPEVTDPDIVITKNPTGEALAVGGNTWFTAHAENALSLTWELVDPDGNVHTVANAVAMNPGLGLEVLEDDTIAVTDAPLSLNGWAVQARFAGQRGTAVTYPAYIFVGDYINAYSPVIERYRKAKNAEISHYGQAHERDVSEWAIDCEYVGYALTDLDRNGIPELLIAGIGTEDANKDILFDLYSFFNDKPVRVCMSTEKGRYYLLSDNRIYYEGSGGASISIHELYTLEGTKLQFQERYFCFYDSQKFGPYFYHTTQDTDHFLEQKPENADEKIPLSDFPARKEAIRTEICLPPLAQLN